MAVIEFHIHVDKDTTVNYSLMCIGIVHPHATLSSSHVVNLNIIIYICIYIYMYIIIYVSAYALPIVIDF